MICNYFLPFLFTLLSVSFGIKFLGFFLIKKVFALIFSFFVDFLFYGCSVFNYLIDILITRCCFVCLFVFFLSAFSLFHLSSLCLWPFLSVSVFHVRVVLRYQVISDCPFICMNEVLMYGMYLTYLMYWM